MSTSTPESLTAALEELEFECQGLEFASAHYDLGKVAELRGQIEDAVQHFERATSYREEPEYLEALGATRLKLGLENEAIAAFERLVRCDDRPETRLKLAEALVNIGGSKCDVTRHLRVAAEEGTSRDPLFYKKLGKLCLAEGLDDVAADILQRGLALAPDDAALSLELARASKVARRYEEAFSHLERTILLEPTNVEAKIVYGDLLLSLGRWNDAVVKYREASELEPKNVAALLGEADAQFEAGCFEKAATLYKSLTACNGSGVRCFVGLAGALSQLKLHREAVDALEACRLNHDDHQLSFSLGVAYLATNQLIKAEGAFMDAAMKNPGDPLSRFYLKKIRARAGMTIE